jgi:hypothetical protein
MERKNKNVFWQAFIIAMVLFWAGILLGVYFEHSRIESVQNFYSVSETEINDFQLSSEIVFGENLSCETLNEKSIFFADKIYREAIKLEKFEDSNQITDEGLVLHRKYDLLRTILWTEIIKNKDICGDNLNTVIYFYEYIEPSFEIRTQQGAMSSFLIDLKERMGKDVVLIPIAADTGVMSIEMLLEKYNITSIPSVIVNEKHVINELSSLEDIEKYLN